MTLAGPIADRLSSPRATALPTPLGVPAAPLGVRDRLAAIRDRLYESAAFRRWAGRVPVVRNVARARSRALFDLVAGFAYTQTLAACVRLDLPALLRHEPLTTAELARRLTLPAEGLERLLRAAAALQLVEQRSGHRWGLGPMGAPLLADPGLAQMIEHNALLYDELRDPLALLRRPSQERGTALSAYWPYVDGARRERLAGADVSGYSALMSATVGAVADEVLDAVSLGGRRHLLDVGGGEGGFVGAAARRHPHLALSLFDLPAVAVRARRRLTEAGLAGRVTVHGGDFQGDALPKGADVVSLVRVCLDHDDATVRALLARVRAALPRGGEVVVAEPFAGVRGAETVGDVYFGFYLWAMGRGRARRVDELRALLADAGFRRIRVRPTRYPVQVGVMVGTA